MTDKWAEHKQKFCGCKDASRLNRCQGRNNCELPEGHPERVSAAPRQPEGDGLEVVAYECLADSHVSLSYEPLGDNPVPLWRAPDAKRAIAELRDMLSGEVETNVQLRQQAFDLTEQRDKLVGLLRDVRPIVALEVERWARAAALLPVNTTVESGLLARIDAALAEGNK